MGLSRDDSVDIFGQVCFQLLTNLKKLRSSEKILSYVATTARREVLATVRRGKLLDSAREADLINVTAQPGADPDEILQQSERTELLIKAIMRLPERESRLIWHLFLDREEPSYEAIAAKLKMPVASIGPTRARALEKLSKILVRQGYQF